jgi:hypothetical protein
MVGALLSGINVIDTSANYADGGSEVLVGKVFNELISSRRLRREDLTLVTKGGYIQGKNLLVAKARVNENNPFSDVFEFNDRLWHSISPDFLEDQFARQFERLGVNYVDTYLLHNPEYSLSYRNSGTASLADNRNAFYERIAKAFEFLEGKVKEGIIGSYGISSNTFVSYKDSTEFVSLEKCIEVAERVAGKNNHFDSVQFPLNLFESGAVSVRNNAGGTKSVLEFAHENNKRVYINRPLNAITSAGLVRLADFKAEEFKEKDFIRQIQLIRQIESDISDEKLPAAGFEGKELRLVTQILSTGKMIEENWKFFGSIEHFNDMIIQTYTPAIKQLTELMMNERIDGHLQQFMQAYINECHRLMNYVSNYYKLRAEKRAVFITTLINDLLDPRYHDLPLSQKALLITASVKGVDCVLLGMRKQQYVDDALAVMKMDKIHNAEEIISHVSSEIMNVKT